jgi:hypothetical protein
MKVKTSELSGAQLDRAVKQAIKKDGGYFLPSKNYKDISHAYGWSYGGPIIEREGISLDYIGVDEGIRVQAWYATKWSADDLMSSGSGPTPLVAAMRCYVASKLGEEVEVPDDTP